MKYKCIRYPTESEYLEKKSKFLGYAFIVKDEEEIKINLKNLKLLHPKARHICYAWRLGAAGEIYKIDDDGEPSGTAGLPIINQLKSFELTYVLLAVVRYFGGVKLGTSGLTSAYKKAAHDCLESAEIIAETERLQLLLKVGYEHHKKLLHFLKTENCELLEEHFDEQVQLKLGIPKENFTEVKNKLIKLQYITLLP